MKAPTIAIIGVSGYARLICDALMRVLLDTPGSLVAATVINAAEEADVCQRLRAIGCEIFSDYRDMLRQLHGRIDLCVIPTSIHWHMPMALDAMAAGAHVLVEKPLAGSVEDSRAILDASRKYGKTVAVGFQHLYLPEIWEMKQLLLSGKLGRVESIEIAGSWPRDKAYYTRNRWAGRTHCDGRAVYDSPLNNAFAHFLNLGLFFATDRLGDFASVTDVAGRLLRFFPIETYDTAAIRLTTAEGMPIDCRLTHADSQLHTPQVLVHASAGELVWNTEMDSIAYDAKGRELQRWIFDPEKCTREPMLRQVINAIANHQPVLCPAVAAHHHVEVIARINSTLPITAAASDPHFRTHAASWKNTSGVFGQLQSSTYREAQKASHSILDGISAHVAV